MIPPPDSSSAQSYEVEPQVGWGESLDTSSPTPCGWEIWDSQRSKYGFMNLSHGHHLDTGSVLLPALRLSSPSPQTSEQNSLQSVYAGASIETCGRVCVCVCEHLCVQEGGLWRQISYGKSHSDTGQKDRGKSKAWENRGFGSDLKVSVLKQVHTFVGPSYVLKEMDARVQCPSVDCGSQAVGDGATQDRSRVNRCRWQ